MASYLNSILNIATQFAITIVNGFVYQPLTQLKLGSIFTDMQIPINFVNQAGKWLTGQAYGSSSILAKPNFQEGQPYKPADTTPPRAFPVFQPNGYQVPLGVNPASMYSFSAEGLRLLKSFEMLSQRPYIANGQRYIAYGKVMSENDKTTYVSRDQADAMLNSAIGTVVSLVKGAISVPITQGQFDALVDFAFTVDANKFKNSTVVQKINGGDIPGAATAFAQWVYATQNGVVAAVPRLVARRTAFLGHLTAPVDPLPPAG